MNTGSSKCKQNAAEQARLLPQTFSPSGMRFLARLASHTRSLHHRPSRQCFSTSLLRANAEPSEPAQTSPAVDDADVVGSMEEDDMLLKELNKELDNVSTNESTEPIYDLERTVEDFKHDDITSIGHLMLRNQRQLLKYLRLIEMEVPLLSGISPIHAHAILLSDSCSE